MQSNDKLLAPIRSISKIGFAIPLVLWLGILCNPSFAQEKPLKVFVLVGQSNMQGHADVKTLPHIGMDPKTKPILDEIVDENGVPKSLDDVWISYLSSDGVKSGKLTAGFGASDNKIGPELTFGIYMQKRIGEPVLIIKAAWGGKSINTDFRPPSAGPYEFPSSVLDRLKQQGKDIEEIKSEKVKATGIYYRQTIDHVKSVLADIKSVYPDYDATQGYELAGLVWFQGWNDMVDSGTYPDRGQPGGYDSYSEVLRHLIRDFRKDLNAPKLPFVVGVMGAGGPTKDYGESQKRYVGVHQNFRDAMAAPAGDADFQGNVFNVLTEEYWDQELDSLIERDGSIQQQIKKLVEAGTLDKKDQKAKLEALRTESFSKRELEVLQIGRSNQAYHYLGCGKIMAQIGKAFAEAIPLN